MLEFRMFENQERFAVVGRQVLRDISGSPFAGRVHSAGNVVSSSLDLYSPTITPDEEVIFIRGQRTPVDAMSSSFSELDSDNDDDADFLWTSSSRETPSFMDQHRKQLRPSRLEDHKRRRLSEIKPRTNDLLPLQSELQAFSRDQLSRTIDRLVARHPQLEVEVRETLSVPDLQPMKERLEYLKRAIYRAFPTFQWGSSRNSYCYRRVRVPIDIFKRTCIDQAKTLVLSQCWEVVINYVEMAWTYVYLMPKFDDPANNRPRLSCFRFLAAQCMMAILNGKFTADKLIEIRAKLTQLQHQHAGIEPCIRKIDKLLISSDTADSTLPVSSTPNTQPPTTPKRSSIKSSVSHSLFLESLTDISSSSTKWITFNDKPAVTDELYSDTDIRSVSSKNSPL